MHPAFSGHFQPSLTMLGIRLEKPEIHAKIVQNLGDTFNSFIVPSDASFCSVLCVSSVFQSFPALNDDSENHAPLSPKCAQCADPEHLPHLHQHIYSQMSMFSDVSNVFQPFPALVDDARDPPQKPQEQATQEFKTILTPTLSLHAPSACPSYSVLNASGIFRPFPALVDDARDLPRKTCKTRHTSVENYLHTLTSITCTLLIMYLACPAFSSHFQPSLMSLRIMDASRQNKHHSSTAHLRQTCTHHKHVPLILYLMCPAFSGHFQPSLTMLGIRLENLNKTPQKSTESMLTYSHRHVH